MCRVRELLERIFREAFAIRFHIASNGAGSPIAVQQTDSMLAVTSPITQVNALAPRWPPLGSFGTEMEPTRSFGLLQSHAACGRGLKVRRRFISISLRTKPVARYDH